MAVNELTASYDTIRKTVALELGWDRVPGSWTPTQDSDFSLIIDEGLRQFYRPPVLPGEAKSHNWTFLYPLGEIELVTSYSTGTITVSVGGVVLVGGVWPSWADEGELWFTDTNGDPRRTEITTRTDDTNLVATNTTYAAASGTSYTIRRRYYDLPDDFGGMYSSEFTFRRDEQWNASTIRIVSERMIRERDREYNLGIYPEFAAVLTVPPTATQSSRSKVMFWPPAQQQWFVEYRYFSIPPTMKASFPYHYGGADHSETVIASCVDRAYQRIHASTEKRNYFMDRLQQSVYFDRRNFMPDYGGQGAISDGTSGGGWGQSLRDFRSNVSPDDINFNLG